jgi:hypothetical protein
MTFEIFVLYNLVNYISVPDEGYFRNRVVYTKLDISVFIHPDQLILIKINMLYFHYI